jgi:hypothetical protein
MPRLPKEDLGHKQGTQQRTNKHGKEGGRHQIPDVRKRERVESE